VFIVGTAAVKGNNPSSSAEQSSSSVGGYAAVTVALAVGLGAVFAALVIIIIVVVVRRVNACQRKNTADCHLPGSITADTSRGTVPVTGLLPTWGFESIRSKYSVTSQDSINSQSS